MQVINDQIERFGGTLDVEVIRDGADGPVVISKQQFHNLVLNTGKKELLRMATGLNAKLFHVFKVGTGVTAATATQTNLVTPVVGSQHTADSKSVAPGGRTLQLIVSYPSGSATTTGGVISAAGIAEVVVLDSKTTTTDALMRAVFASTVNKTKADKLKIVYNVRIS